MSLTHSEVSNIHQMTLVGLMTAIICILAPFSFPLPFSPVPVSLGTLAVYLTAAILGLKKSFFSTLLYLLLGLAGLPVFTGFTGGIGKLLGPTGGYLIGYIFIALVSGYFADYHSNHVIFLLTGMVLGTGLCYAFGTIWLSHSTELSLLTALSTGVLPFLPVDIIKILIASTIGLQIRKRLKKAALL